MEGESVVSCLLERERKRKKNIQSLKIVDFFVCYPVMGFLCILGKGTKRQWGREGARAGFSCLFSLSLSLLYSGARGQQHLLDGYCFLTSRRAE
jgi:hypothetical protein